MSIAEKLSKVEENVPKVYQAGFNAGNGNAQSLCANALVGNVTGEIVSMDDVSPLKHKMPFKVRRKNEIPYPFTRTTQTITGITFTDNGDGTITANGTATERTVFYFGWYVSSPLPLPKGIYTLSGAPAGASYNNYYLSIAAINGEKQFDANSIEGSNFTGELNALRAVYITIGKGITVNNLVFKPQLELDTTATAYAPYIADDEVITVRSCGKNLIDINCDYKVSNDAYRPSIIIENNKINNISVAGGYDCWILFNREYPAGTYTICTDKETTDTDGTLANHCRILINVEADKAHYNQYYQNWYMDTDKNTPITFTTTEPFKIGFAFGGASGCQMSYYNIMLNKGAPEAYEPCIEGEEIITTLGNGAELTSIAPNMTIYTDKEGAIIECSYNKDTNKVIERLTQAVISLGGKI